MKENEVEPSLGVRRAENSLLILEDQVLHRHWCALEIEAGSMYFQWWLENLRWWCRCYSQRQNMNIVIPWSTDKDNDTVGKAQEDLLRRLCEPLSSWTLPGTRTRNRRTKTSFNKNSRHLLTCHRDWAHLFGPLSLLFLILRYWTSHRCKPWTMNLELSVSALITFSYERGLIINKQKNLRWLLHLSIRSH